MYAEPESYLVPDTHGGSSGGGGGGFQPQAAWPGSPPPAAFVSGARKRRGGLARKPARKKTHDNDTGTRVRGWYNMAVTWTPYRKQLPPAAKPFPQLVEMTWTPRRSLDEIYLYGETLIPDAADAYAPVKCELKDEDLLQAACLPSTSIIAGMWELKTMPLHGQDTELQRWVLVQPFQLLASHADRTAFLAEMMTAMMHPVWGPTMVLHYDGMARSLLGEAAAAALPPQLQPPRHEAYDPEEAPIPSSSSPAMAARTTTTTTMTRTRKKPRRSTRWERMSLTFPEEDVDMESTAQNDEYDPERPAM